MHGRPGLITCERQVALRILPSSSVSITIPPSITGVTDRNGLQADSAADFLQVRSVSSERFVARLGTLEAGHVEEIVAGVAIAIDYQP